MILARISSLLAEGYSLVFPSEVVADFYLHSLLRANHCATLRKDRLLSWDRWKKKAMALPDHMPVTALIRYCFAESVVREIAGTTESPASLSDIAEVLPFLPTLMQAPATNIRRAFPELPMLFERYRDFLASRRLFELNWQPVPRPHKVAFFTPELCMDNAAYQDAIHASSTPVISLSSLSPAEHLHMRRFHSAEEEIDTVMQEVANLLEKGVATEEIVITVADLPHYAVHIENAAQRYGLPLHIAQARSLSITEGSRVFPLLEEVRKNGLDHDSLELLFLDPSLDWKADYREIIRLGKLHYCVRGTSNFQKDRWLSVLPAPLKTRYVVFKRFLHRLSRKSSFQMLLQELHAFLYQELSSLSLMPLQLAFQQLRHLATEECILDIPIHNHWQLFLSLLHRMPYIASTKRQAVSVYPYQVSAGIYPEFHFLINMNHHDTRVTPPVFLSDYAMSTLSLAQQSFSKEYLDAYHASGRHLYMSSSIQGMEANHPPALPLLHAEVIPATSVYQQEKALWMQKESRLPAALQQWQHRSLAAYQKRQAPGPNYRKVAVADIPLKDTYISASRLDDYQKTPFAYLLRSQNPLQPFLQMAREKLYPIIGSIYHQVLAKTLAPFVGQTFPSEIAHGLIDAHLAEAWQPVGLYTLIPQILKIQAKKYLGNALDKLCARLAGTQLLSLEKEYSQILDATQLKGKVDLLAESTTGLIIIDYKRSQMPNPRMLPWDGYTSLQVPFYLWLVQKEQSDRKIHESSYYSILGQRFARMDETPIERIEHYLTDLLQRMSAGDFTCLHPPCKDCPFPSLCRRDYLI